MNQRTETNIFRIVITAFNCENYIKKCLTSLIEQSYSNWTSVIIDDSSIDKTVEIAESIIQGNSKITLIQNKTNEWPLSNIVKGINLLCKDNEDIVVIIDGADWFSNNNVLSYLNDVYNSDKIWMTYGGVELSNPEVADERLKLRVDPEEPEIFNASSYRKLEEWKVGNLKSFKKKIWNYIKDNDLRNKRGKYYKVCADAAYLYPLVELCGKSHIKMLENIVYIRNNENPFFEDKINDEIFLGKNLREIKRKNSYKPILEES